MSYACASPFNTQSQHLRSEALRQQKCRMGMRLSDCGGAPMAWRGMPASRLTKAHWGEMKATDALWSIDVELGPYCVLRDGLRGVCCLRVLAIACGADSIIASLARYDIS